MATDKLRALALECDDLSDDQLLEILAGVVGISTGQTVRTIMQSIGPVAKRSAALTAALEPTLVAYRKGTLDERADLLASNACWDCRLGKLPALVAPATVSADTPFHINPAAVYGGAHLGLGDPTCAVVRYEVIVCASPPGDPATGFVLHSESITPTTGSLSVDPEVTITAAQMAAMGSPAAVAVYLRAYACDDLSYKQDYAVVDVL